MHTYLAHTCACTQTRARANTGACAHVLMLARPQGHRFMCSEYHMRATSRPCFVGMNRCQCFTGRPCYYHDMTVIHFRLTQITRKLWSLLFGTFRGAEFLYSSPCLLYVNVRMNMYVIFLLRQRRLNKLITIITFSKCKFMIGKRKYLSRFSNSISTSYSCAALL